jgi:DNA-binding NarL/FixJ family response regulator
MRAASAVLSEPQQGQSARVFIVDDHHLLRRGLTDVINREPDLSVSGEADSMAAALREIRDASPDVAIIDISLKDGSGLDLVKQVKLIDSSIRMLVLSMHDEMIYAERAMRAGALGYVNKQASAETILTAVRRVSAGHVYVSNKVSERLLERMAGKKGIEKSPVEALSDRELAVFELIGQGLGTRQIAKMLFLSVKTVESHRERIKSKLKLTGGTELTRRAVEWVLQRS